MRFLTCSLCIFCLLAISALTSADSGDCEPSSSAAILITSFSLLSL
eukprot:COSAG06_NODE_14655_length_1138_cov_1.587103_1_plen_45_part_10